MSIVEGVSSDAALFPRTRLRRLRRKAGLRALVRETILRPDDLVCPLFVRYGDNERRAIGSLPGHFQLSVDHLADEAKQIAALGIPAVILFGIPAQKDATGSAAYAEDSIIAQAIAAIKSAVPELLIIADTCCCEYTDHSHCGILRQREGKHDVDNDATLAVLARQALIQANAGADIIAPSGMMDGMVAYLRRALDEAEYPHVAILSYAVKYASSFYGAFREAAESQLALGDNRATYQMDMANAEEALREAGSDVAEGADMLMVKPAGSYLDIVQRLRQAHPGVPLAAYQVSGEYAMIKAAAQQGWLDEPAAALESLVAIKRAGARFILSYFAKEVATLLVGGEYGRQS